MTDRIIAFLKDLDQALISQAGEATLDLYHIGRSALVWEYGYAATTSDIDIIRPQGPQHLIDAALALFGKESAKARQHGLYLDVVHEAIPPVPGGFEKRATKVDGDWVVLRVYHLSPHDIAATKLRRFAAKDREDLRQLCDLGLLDPGTLGSTLEKAYPFNLAKDGDEYRDRAFANLAIVQRYLRGELTEF